MVVTEKGQVTIPKQIRTASGVGPGSKVVFGLEGSKIVITASGTKVKEDRRAKMRAAAGKVRESMSAEFAQLSADQIVDFLRADGASDVKKPRVRNG